MGLTGTCFPTLRMVREQVLDYSLAVTACANGINVEEYFYRMLTSDVPIMPWDK